MSAIDGRFGSGGLERFFALDVSSIHYRQDAVENLIDDEKLMFQTQTILLHFTDVERRIERIVRWNVRAICCLGIILACIQENPSRTVPAAEKRITMLNQLRRILDILPSLQQALDQASSDLLKNLSSVDEISILREST